MLNFVATPRVSRESAWLVLENSFDKLPVSYAWRTPFAGLLSRTAQMMPLVLPLPETANDPPRFGYISKESDGGSLSLSGVFANRLAFAWWRTEHYLRPENFAPA
jgi:hypothetical protein